jgi:hypothetical protein
MYATRHRMVSIFAFLATSLIFACGRSDTKQDKATPSSERQPDKPATQAAPEQLDACSLLTKAEVEAAVGRAVKNPVGDTTANVFGCNYGDPRDPAGLDKVVAVGVLAGNDAAAARQVLETARSNAAHAEPVAGLGDMAFWDDAPRFLQVAKGRYELSLYLSHDAGGRDTARKLAGLLLARLP